MSVLERIRLLPGVVGFAVASLVTMPTAPGVGPATPNLPNCERGAGTTLYCDGPVNADHSWERCIVSPGYEISVIPGSYLAPTRKCLRVTQDRVPEGSPTHHIG